MSERVAGLRRNLGPHDKLGQLREDLAKLQAERLEAVASLQEAIESANQHRSRLHEFDERFGAVIKELRPPWYEREARIDLETYLPIIETDTFDELGGGVRGSVNIAYHVALLGYALIIGSTYLPSVLIIDSPRRNLGSNPIDRALAHRIYDHFLTLQNAREGAHTPPFQIIVADNDVPAAASRRSRRIAYSHDDPFVPGVQYAAAEASGDDDQE